MTEYAVEFLNHQTIDVVAASRKAAVYEAECLARANRWPSVHVVRTYRYDRSGRRSRPKFHLCFSEPHALGLFEPDMEEATR